MSNLYLVKRTFLAAALLTAVACSKNGTATSENTVGGETVLQLSTCTAHQTKTWLDFSAGTSPLPVYWSNGDRVNVNGVASSPISVEQGQRLSNVEFKVRNIEPPYTIFYPAESFESLGDDGVVSFNIPATQEYSPDSFGCGAAMLYGYAESSEEPVELQNLCGAISVALSSADPVTITSVALTSLGEEPIAGRFTFDPVSGELEAVEGTCEVKLNLPAGGGINLSKNGTRFVFTIPAGDYPEGFRLRFDDSSKHSLKNYWLRPSKDAETGVSVIPGHIVCFSAQEYQPDAREIMDASDWDEFAMAYNAGTWQKDWLGKDGKIHVGADFTATTLKSLNAFSHELDGQGFTITQTSAKLPLFGDLTGTVSNLTLAGKMTEPQDPGNAGAVVFAKSMTSNAKIVNCCNECEISVPLLESKMLAAAFVRNFKGGVIENCTNNGAIKLNIDCTSIYPAVVAGGFIATVPSMDASGLVKNCTNNGSINIVITKQASAAYSPSQAGYGGIAGTVVAGNASNFLALENCTNNGNISVDYSVANTGAVPAMSGVGGIVGTAMKYNTNGRAQSYWTRLPASVDNQDGVVMSMTGCTNNGDLFNGLVCNLSSDDPYKAFCGGLAGVLNGTASKHITATSCANYGKVKGNESPYTRSALCVVTGGLCGFGGYVDFDKCTVQSKQIGSLKRQAYSAAIGIGYAMMTFSLTDCYLYADVQHIRCTNYSEGNYAIAFNLSTKQNTAGGVWWPFVKIEGSRVSGCHVGGNLILSKEVVAYNAATPTVTETTPITASNLVKYMASPSFTADYFQKGFPSMVTIEGNTYWNGK